MYIHLGNEMVVSEKDIVGIFDLETTTISKHSRKFLEIAEKQKQVINVSYELPKSFIITNKNNENKVYISQISTGTLQKRSKIL
ncbi:MAG: DUF370 domain-containing protein [Clostridia bacterium]|nr:DUF370 domain-containing protein [Clostridia bacterium]